MTNIQAINLLKGLEQSLDDYCELNDEGKTAFRMAVTALEVFGISEQLPSAQPKTGQWINKGVISGGGVIEKWQECQCSECKRWDTRPYMYYFDEPKFCSFCGAKMGVKE